MHRILYVHHCPDWGGASASLLSLIEHLDRRRYSPSILFNAGPGSATRPFEKLGIPVYYEPSITTYPHAQGALLQLRSLRPWEIVTRALMIAPSARRFAAFLGAHPQDLVHLNSMVQVPAALGAKSSGVPLVWHVREELHPGFIGVRRRLIRDCIDRCADAVIAISERNAALLRPSPRIRVVYNFMDLDRFRRDIDKGRTRDALGLPGRAPIVLMLGGIVAHKGADVFLEAAARVRASLPDALFLVAGLPPTGSVSPSPVRRLVRGAIESTGLVENVERTVLRRWDELRLGDSFRFIGLRTDVPELLAAADLLVWPATVSHFSRPVIEAGSVGRPVVASDFPASRELVHQGETGILVPPRDPRALAAAIVDVLINPDTASRMGEAGWRLAQERYDARRNTPAILRVYDEVLGMASLETPKQASGDGPESR
jgi:glycosyltransferase involved in cell wall biosynthesis